jgi:hypothetical protein
MKKEDISNTYIHLTNVAIQKHAPNFDRGKGMKWPIRSLRMYLNTRHGAWASLHIAALYPVTDSNNSVLVSLSAAHTVSVPWVCHGWTAGIAGFTDCLLPVVRQLLFCCCCCCCCCCLGPEATNELFNSIQNVILRALLAVQPSMINDKHCFEVSCCCSCTCGCMSCWHTVSYVLSKPGVLQAAGTAMVEAVCALWS